MKEYNSKILMAKHQEGFSLVELLVVMLIMAILAAIVIPMFIGMKNRARDASIVTTAHTSAKTGSLVTCV